MIFYFRRSVLLKFNECYNNCMKSNRKDIELVLPDVERDAVFALGWFERPEGRQTLLSMGNAEHEISSPTIEGEEETIRQFIQLESDNKQITRMISVDNKTIGAVWIELYHNHNVQPPSVHIIIGNPEYRGKGIGVSVMKSAIDYANKVLGYQNVYSRHLVNNQAIAAVNKTLGLKDDGASYTDENGLIWQNVKLTMAN